MWLSFAVLMMAAGGGLIKYVGAIFENGFSTSSIISIAILYPEKDRTFYADSTPEVTVFPGDNAQSLSVPITAKVDNLPIFILSNIRQDDCLGSLYPTDPRLSGLWEDPLVLTTNTTKSVNPDLFEARDGTLHKIPLSAVSFIRHDAPDPIASLVLYCTDIIHARHVTFTERQIIFKYYFFDTSGTAFPPARRWSQKYSGYKNIILVASDFERYEVPAFLKPDNWTRAMPINFG